MNNQNTLQETLALVKAAQAAPLPDEIAKAFTQSGSPTAGLTAYDLQAPALKIYPLITPLRNRIARVGGGVGTAVNWRSITAINANNLEGGVGEGNRGGVLGTTVQSVTAAYKGLGFEDYATFEADMAANGFDDVKARAVEGLLRSLMIYEERVILGGNSGRALGVTPTPTVATSTTGGTVAAATYNVICIALTLEGFLKSSVANGLPIAAIARTNADASVDTYGGGVANKSTAASQITTGATSVITGTVALVTGAYAYAWYVGTAGTERLYSLTTINSVNITSIPSTSQLASAVAAVDNSQNALVFDGLLSQITNASGSLTVNATVGSTATIYISASGSLVGQMATGVAGTGTVLTADGKGGIVEIDAMLKAAWDNYRLTYDTIYVSAQEAQNIEQKILTGNSNPAFRFNIAANQAGLTGGMAVASYLNKFAPGGAIALNILVHPNLVPGTILFYSEGTPYPVSNVGNLIQVKTRRDYYQLEWPLRSRKYEYGVYTDELLQNYFPPAFAILTNVANG